MLTAIAITIVLASIMIAAVCKAYKSCKEWIFGICAHNENRINAFIDDSRSAERWQMYYATNKPVRWSFINENSTN